MSRLTALKTAPATVIEDYGRLMRLAARGVTKGDRAAGSRSHKIVAVGGIFRNVSSKTAV